MRVVGLNIHPERVSAVEVDTAFGRFEIRDMHDLRVDEGVEPEAAAYRLIASLPRTPDRLVITAPSEICTFRNLQIASKDKKAVRSALEFELEDDLPFDRENLHYDFSILSSGLQGSSIHVGATKKESFSNHLKHLQSMGIDPEVITTDPWAYRCLFQRIISDKPVLLIGIEQNKTFFYIHNGNKPILYREAAFGLKKIENHLEETYSATKAEIQSWMRDVGLKGVDERISNSIAECMESLIPELKQTELASRTSLDSPIEQIWVTGEGSLIPGLMNWLEQATGKSALHYRPFALLSQNKLSYSNETEIGFSKALAAAMAIIPADKTPVINFRKGSFAKTSSESDSLMDLIRKPLPYLAIMSLVFFATKGVEYQYYKGRLSDMDDSLRRAVKNYFGTTTGNSISDNAVRNHLADPDKLKSTVQTEVTKQREMSKLFTPNTNSPLDFLKSLSQRIGRDVVIDLIRFNAGTELTDTYRENRPFKTEMTFIAANPQIIAKLSEVLETGFHLKKGNTEEVTEEGRKLLKITFSGTVESSK